MSPYVSIPPSASIADAPKQRQKAYIDSTYLTVYPEEPYPTGLVDHRGHQIYSIKNPIGFNRS